MSLSLLPGSHVGGHGDTDNVWRSSADHGGMMATVAPLCSQSQGRPSLTPSDAGASIDATTVTQTKLTNKPKEEAQARVRTRGSGPGGRVFATCHAATAGRTDLSSPLRLL